MTGDMLVQLLKLKPIDALTAKLRRAGIVIKRPNAYEMTVVVEFVRTQWSQGWADEVTVAFSRQPIGVFVALRKGKLIGFSAYECTRRNFFGPMGVLEKERGKDIGNALLLSALWGLRELGYVYAIIGGVGPVDFYAKRCGAELISDSSPGIYTDRIEG
jgi:GNAT superfamily N-acetyltransferase